MICWIPSLFYAPWKSHHCVCAVYLVISHRHSKAGEHCLRHQLQAAETGLAAGRGSLVLLLFLLLPIFLCQCKCLCSHITNEIREQVGVEAFWGRISFGWVRTLRWSYPHQGRCGTGAQVSVQTQASLAFSVSGLVNSHFKWL